jgi:hypothetical protein
VRRPIRNVIDVRGSYFPDSAAPSVALESEDKSNGPSCRIPLMKKVGVPFTPLRAPLRNRRDVSNAVADEP